MTQQKDLKRLVRTRMKKTGESYTAARAQLVQKKPDTGPSEAELARAGMADDVVQSKTGKTWREWVKHLDAAGAKQMAHAEIARHLHAVGVPSWWSQMVTVGYERIRGLREHGQRRGGLFDAGKTKTVAVPIDALYEAWSNARKRAKWLPGVKLTVRTAIPKKSMRITWPDGTSVLVGFLAKGAGKSAVTLVHTNLPSKAEVTARKAYWAERLAALADLLAK